MARKPSVPRTSPKAIRSKMTPRFREASKKSMMQKRPSQPRNARTIR